MFKQLLHSLTRRAARPGPASGAVPGRTEQARAAHAAFERQCAELRNPAHADDATLQTLLAYAHVCYEVETAAADAECERALRRALALDPNHPQALYALALLISADARLAEAETHLRAAYALAPDDLNVRFALVMCLLGRSNYPEGYRLFGVRLETPSHPAPHIAALPAWRGEALAGKTLVLWTDWGGFGDDVAYARYARAIREVHRPARLIVAVRKPMQGLLGSQAYVDQAVDLDTAVEADLQCSMIEAVGAMASEFSTLPGWPAYLEAPARQQQQWQRRLQGEQRLKVGLVWTSTSAPLVDLGWSGRYDKHLPDRTLAALGGLENVVFVSLQKGAGIAKAADLLPGAAVIDVTEELGDFADTAALLRQLDIVVAVDTAVGHLAGALGVPTLLLVKKSRGYFWPEAGTRTPWYPAMRMVAQEKVRDWSPVLARVRATLQRRAAGIPWPECFDQA
ncbi:MAG TPA: glycosyltransferase family 9 protein [Burkholderiales bacterium]|jgi:ADP-heptose:LPS heptosyltransferase|nr:glycosyltransferase family 9 protein [Burkholderiales bacterium]